MKAIKVIWDAICTLAMYAILAAFLVVVIAITPMIAIVVACIDGVELSSAMGEFIDSMINAFYKSYTK